jgi:hypothetical protein
MTTSALSRPAALLEYHNQNSEGQRKHEEEH